MLALKYNQLESRNGFLFPLFGADGVRAHATRKPFVFLSEDQTWSDTGSKPATVFLRLTRNEFIQVGMLHRDGVNADLIEIAELISAGAGLRRIRDRINHWRRFWDLTDADIRGFLQRVESPLEVLKRELAGNEAATELFKRK